MGSKLKLVTDSVMAILSSSKKFWRAVILIFVLGLTSASIFGLYLLVKELMK